jgi:hypothetical protein
VQGFYFRHDSEKNPAFEKNMRKYEGRVGYFVGKIAKEMISQEDALDVIFEKI